MKAYHALVTLRVVLLALFLSGTAFAQTGHDCTGNESWLPVGNGLEGMAITSTEMNGDLYVLHETTITSPPTSDTAGAMAPMMGDTSKTDADSLKK